MGKSTVLRIPTYYGDEKAEFAPPMAEVTVAREAGVRIVMRGKGIQGKDAPDLLVERRAHGWVVFVHPAGERSDPELMVVLRDNGRMTLVPEMHVELDVQQDMPADVDGPPPG